MSDFDDLVRSTFDEHTRSADPGDDLAGRAVAVGRRRRTLRTAAAGVAAVVVVGGIAVAANLNLLRPPQQAVPAGSPGGGAPTRTTAPALAPTVPTAPAPTAPTVGPPAPVPGLANGGPVPPTPPPGSASKTVHLCVFDAVGQPVAVETRAVETAVLADWKMPGYWFVRGAGADAQRLLAVGAAGEVIPPERPADCAPYYRAFLAAPNPAATPVGGEEPMWPVWECVYSPDRTLAAIRITDLPISELERWRVPGQFQVEVDGTIRVPASRDLKPTAAVCAELFRAVPNPAPPWTPSP